MGHAGADGWVYIAMWNKSISNKEAAGKSWGQEGRVCTSSSCVSGVRTWRSVSSRFSVLRSAENQGEGRVSNTLIPDLDLRQDKTTVSDQGLGSLTLSRLNLRHKNHPHTETCLGATSSVYEFAAPERGPGDRGK